MASVLKGVNRLYYERRRRGLEEKNLRKYQTYLMEAESLERILNNGFRGNKAGRQKRLQDLQTRLIPRLLHAIVKMATD